MRGGVEVGGCWRVVVSNGEGVVAGVWGMFFRFGYARVVGRCFNCDGARVRGCGGGGVAQVGSVRMRRV